ANTNLSISPNPANDVLHIQGSAENEVIRVIDVNGTIVLSTSETNVNIAHLPSGIYFVQVQGQCQKVIKL
ncbi:MAG: T9SS type A sorting domain-containing protein, partial [Crocinitomicaceae bacterium]